ncbi:MAG: hypothetical protein F2796_02495, partial [Actinobacteria bacterium]|nr:hypothetical protein [Actinomycetota bacterium]
MPGSDHLPGAPAMSVQEQISPTVPEPPTGELLVSVVIPCLNEEENIEACVRSALEAMEAAG